jgi:hypothetical protein
MGLESHQEGMIGEERAKRPRKLKEGERKTPIQP